MLVRVEDGIVTNKPIAGTSPRGRDEAEDKRLEQALLHDEKERAEHTMLVDLGRNDVGRVCECGTVEVHDFMHVERASKVMHLVSEVRGKLRSDKTAADALFSVLPAGTLSGAPKIRAMQIIDELETVKRGVYGGAIGYLGFDGNIDTCIAIRTALFRNGKAYVQAGMGVVADSDPEKEYRRVGQTRHRPCSTQSGRRQNYDSSSRQLRQLHLQPARPLGIFYPDIRVVRSDKITLDEIEAMNPQAIVISPGPGYPKDAGISVEAVRRFSGKIPILGVCLGHQSIGEAFGGKTVPAARLMHGKASAIAVDRDCPLFRGLPDEIRAARYHSLILDPDFPAGLPESYRAGCRRPDHGHTAPHGPDVRRPVSPGIHFDCGRRPHSV